MISKTLEITPDKCKDAGLALVLIFLICLLTLQQQIFLVLAIVFLVITMTYPPLFKPFAKLWFGLSTALGTVVSKILLALLFYLLVFPVGLIRRVLGKDSMQLKSWKKENASVFRVRNHRFTAEDLKNPF